MASLDQAISRFVTTVSIGCWNLNLHVADVMIISAVVSKINIYNI